MAIRLRVALARAVPVVAGCALAIALAFAAPAPAARAQPQRAAEYSVKAAFLFQFTRFIRWPQAAFPSAEAPFRLCLWGTDPFGAALARVEGTRYDTHPIRVERPRDPVGLEACHMIYIGDDAPLGGAATVRLLAGRSVMAVSSEPGFAEAGGALEFVIRDNRVRMVINTGALRAARLAPSAKLIEVADRVIGAPGGGR